MLLAGVSQAGNKELRTSICELGRQEKAMNGASIRLSATYLTDLFEHSSLWDAHCPDLSMNLDWSVMQTHPHDQSLDALDAALQSDVFPPMAMSLSIDVSGRFIAPANKTSRGRLVMEKVWSFRKIPEKLRSKKRL
jgi:hypothetical protein